MMSRPQSSASLAALPLLVKRNLVLGGALLLAVLFLAGGIYILTRGRIGLPLAKAPQPGKVIPYSSRLALAALYLAVATGVGAAGVALGHGVTWGAIEEVF